MGCYIIPASAALIHTFLRRKIPAWRTSEAHTRLSLLLFGGAIFGLVDHAWNRELLYRKENLWADLALGVTITIVIFLVWGVMTLLSSVKVRYRMTSHN
jgi:hypothetical protein